MDEFDNLAQKYWDPGMPITTVEMPKAAPQAIAPLAQKYDMDPALARSYTEERAMLAQLQDALGKQQPKKAGPTDAEAYFRIAAAFGKPTKTGSFFESLGPVSESIADTLASRKEAERANAAQQLANIQARMELIKQSRDLTREEGMQRMLYKYLNKGQNVIDEKTGTRQAAGDDLPDDMKALILAQPTDKAVATLIDIAKENNKPSDLIKGVKFLVKNGHITDEDGAAIIQENLQGKLEQVDVNVGELGGTYKMTGPEARAYYNKGILPERLGGKKTAPPAGTVETAPSGEIKPTGTTIKPMSQEQMKAQETALTEQAKADIEEGKTLVAGKPFAQKQVILAKSISDMAKNNPKAFGIIADPGLGNAIATIVDKGVNTPWGSVSLNVEEPLAKLKLSKEDLQARRQVLQPLTELEVGFRKLFLKGEGPVSNMEGELAKFIGPQLSDDTVTIQRKAGMIIIGAEKQAKVIDEYQKYKAAHPAAGPQAFYQTPEYKRIEDAYDKRYMDFVQKNNIPFEYKGPVSTGGSLVDRLRQERLNRSNPSGQ